MPSSPELRPVENIGTVGTNFLEKLLSSHLSFKSNFFITSFRWKRFSTYISVYFFPETYHVVHQWSSQKRSNPPQMISRGNELKNLNHFLCLVTFWTPGNTTDLVYFDRNLTVQISGRSLAVPLLMNHTVYLWFCPFHHIDSYIKSHSKYTVLHKRLLVVWDFCFWSVWEAGPVLKKSSEPIMSNFWDR